MTILFNNWVLVLFWLKKCNRCLNIINNVLQRLKKFVVLSLEASFDLKISSTLCMLTYPGYVLTAAISSMHTYSSTYWPNSFNSISNWNTDQLFRGFFIRKTRVWYVIPNKIIYLSLKDGTLPRIAANVKFSFICEKCFVQSNKLSFLKYFTFNEIFKPVIDVITLVSDKI